MPRILGYCCNGYGNGHLSRVAALMRALRELESKASEPLDYLLLTEADSIWPTLRFQLPIIKLPSKTTLASNGSGVTESIETIGSVSKAIISTLKPDIIVVDTLLDGTYGEFSDGSILASTYVVFLNRQRNPESASSSLEQSLLTHVDHVIVPHAVSDICVVPTANRQTDWSGPILSMSLHEQMPRPHARAFLGIGPHEIAVLFYGGGGAQTSELPERVATALHQIHPTARLFSLGSPPGAGYVPLSFFPAMEIISAFDAAIATGGYNMVHELLASGIPSAFFPRPTGHDDQPARIRHYEARRACMSIADLEPDTLRAVLGSLLDDSCRAVLLQNSRDAVPACGASRAAELILNRWLTRRR
jgi:hypothetical protein